MTKSLLTRQHLLTPTITHTCRTLPVVSHWLMVWKALVGTVQYVHPQAIPHLIMLDYFNMKENLLVF